jgi:hypothetical protein
MGSTARLVTLCATVSVLAACATAEFVRPDADAFQYGQTNYAVVVAKMGPPRQSGTLVRNDKNIGTIIYGETAGRAATYYFYDKLLVGSEYTSSKAEDSTDFDDSRVAAIVKGKTTRAEVLKLFGKPGGVYVYPMIKTPGADASVYAYLETRGTAFNQRIVRKALILTFDAKGVVSDVEFASDK